MKKRNYICGLECDFARNTDVWLLFLSAGISLDQYYFEVVDAAVYSQNKRIEIPKRFNDDYFDDLLQNSCTGERLILQVYHESEKAEKIDTYHDYTKTQCKMIVLLYDACYVEIYCKNHEWLTNLWNTATNIPNALVELKYETTDSRTGMYV